MLNRYITFRDVLGYQNGLTIEGVQIDAKVVANLRNSDGEIEVVSTTVESAYVVTDTSNAIKIDLAEFEAMPLYQRFLAQVDKIAIEKAKDLPDYKWEEIDYNV